MKIYIAENIRNLRKKYNMKQEQLAEALDVSITAVSKWEREMTTPELKYIVEMADLFEVSVDALLGYYIQSGVCEALEKRIHDLQMKKDYESAQIEAEKALVKYPNNFDLTVRCAEMYQICGIEKRDKKSLRKAIELWNKSLLLILQNKNEEITEYSIRTDIATCHISLGEKETGIELLKKCNINGMNNALIGMIYAISDEYSPDKAASFLEKGFFSCTGDLIRLIEGYTHYYERLGMYELALEMQLWIIKFLKLIKHEKKVSIADKFLAVSYMKCANLSDTMNQKSKVEEYLQQAFDEANLFDMNPSYHISDLKFYLGKTKDGTVYEDTGSTAMESVEECLAERLKMLWEDIKGV